MTALVAAMMRRGRASVLPSGAVTASETTSVVESASPSDSEVVTVHAVADGSTRAKVVTVPSVPESVNVPAKPPVRVSSSEPGSATQPSAAALAVKRTCVPVLVTRSTDVSEVRRTAV